MTAMRPQVANNREETPTSLLREQLQRIESRVAGIGVIGVGYVGLPLALEFVHQGFSVLGFDIDPSKVDTINDGGSYLAHIPAKNVEKARRSGKLAATGDFSRIKEMDAVLICVPTPLDKHRNPDLSYIESTGRLIAPHLKKGVLVSLESTTYPGTTEGVLKPILEEGSNLTAGVDFFLAFSPEREDPANQKHSSRTTPKVVGGLNAESSRLADALYSTIVPKTVMVDSCGVAEATKLLENIFRAVNIALINEMKIILDRMGIDVWDVVAAAATKPFGFMPFYPGPGLGGHCIPIDPFYLVWRAREFGLDCRFIELAGQLNTAMPEYVVNKTIRGLNEEGKAVKDAKILIMGLAYKPDVDDMRESPGVELMERYQALGAVCDYHDPFIPQVPRLRHHGGLQGRKSVEMKDLDFYDAIVICTNHSSVDHSVLLAVDTLIVDTRNVMGKAAGKARVVKA